jgi:hypothetical protein
MSHADITVRGADPPGNLPRRSTLRPALVPNKKTLRPRAVAVAHQVTRQRNRVFNYDFPRRRQPRPPSGPSEHSLRSGARFRTLACACVSPGIHHSAGTSTSAWARQMRLTSLPRLASSSAHFLVACNQRVSPPSEGQRGVQSPPSAIISDIRPRFLEYARVRRARHPPQKGPRPSGLGVRVWMSESPTGHATLKRG